MLVDDDPDLLDFLSTGLSAYENFDILIARDGREALQKFKLEKPDLVVTDLVMPHMDGFLLTDELCCRYQVPVLVMSGNASAHTKKTLMRLGAHAFLEKPITVQQLAEEIKLTLQVFNNKAISGL